MIVILGPTASGKSETAIRLASNLGGEVISADAFQVYRGMDVGTGKVPENEREGIPHHLIDIATPDEQFTAGRFIAMAEKVVEEIRGRDRIPILVGGTGFYIRSYLKGLAPIPPSDPSLREKLISAGDRIGWSRLHRLLRLLDPPSYESVAPHDRQRIERALEVTLSSGRPFSRFHAGEMRRPDHVHAVKIGLTLPREILRKRIEERVHSMIESGWLKEVRRLIDDGYDTSDPGMKAIGYREMAAVLKEELTLEEAVETIVHTTRRYAKRQMTYLKREEKVEWFDVEDRELAMQAIMEYSRRALKCRNRL